MDSGLRRNDGKGVDPVFPNLEARTLNAPE
jgi:hypothetical protein